MKNNNQINVPQAREAMDRFKMQAASEVGVNLTNGYNGHLTSREAGSVGGQMVKKMIEAYEQGLQYASRKNSPPRGGEFSTLYSTIPAKHWAARYNPTAPAMGAADALGPDWSRSVMEVKRKVVTAKTAPPTRPSFQKVC